MCMDMHAPQTVLQNKLIVTDKTIIDYATIICQCDGWYMDVHTVFKLVILVCQIRHIVIIRAFMLYQELHQIVRHMCVEVTMSCPKSQYFAFFVKTFPGFCCQLMSMVHQYLNPQSCLF